MTVSAKNPTPALEWWHGCAIYQIYPRSFQDTNGDGTGDLAGVLRRLPHVASLGVDAIWLSPFFKSPMHDMGYDISDYRAVDPMFGTLADFDAVVAEAHRLGLKVIIDQVLNHTSDQHPWFAESRSDRDNPKADWYVWVDPKPDGTPPNNWLSIFGGPAWEWDTRRQQYYLHNFLVSQPDLNFHDPAVQDAVLDESRFWLERGVDGFRLDAVNFYFHDALLRDNPPLRPGLAQDVPASNPYGYQDHVRDKTQPENLAFLERYRGLLNQYRGRMALGEVGEAQPRSLQTVAAYTAGGDRLDMCYTFDLLGRDFSPAHVLKCVSAFEGAARDGACWAFSNHDVVRHVSRWAGEPADREPVAKLAISLLASLSGSICLYQGEELGLPEAELSFEDLRDPYGIRFWPAFKGRDGCRTPMVWEKGAANGGFSAGRPWLPVPDAHLALAVDQQDGNPTLVLNHYRRMLAFRKAHQPLTHGETDFLEAGREVLAFVRRTATDELLCLFNFSRREVRWAVPSAVRLTALLDADGERRVVSGERVVLRGFGAAFARIA